LGPPKHGNTKSTKKGIEILLLDESIQKGLSSPSKGGMHDITPCKGGWTLFINTKLLVDQVTFRL
jgi:hypothetical protein